MRHLISLTIILIGNPLSCDQPYTQCDTIVDDIRALLIGCGVKVGDYDRGPVDECTETIIAQEECYLACYNDASCQAYLGADKAGNDALVVCISVCIDKYSQR